MGVGLPPSQVQVGGGATPSQVQVEGAGGYPNLNSVACTCYAAGGMPLAFIRRTFLLFTVIAGSLEQLISWILRHMFGLTPQFLI